MKAINCMIDTTAINSAINSAMSSTRIEPKYRVFRHHCLDYKACSNIVHRWGRCQTLPQAHLQALYGEGCCLALNEITKWSLPLTLQVFSYISHYKLLARYRCPKLVDVYMFLTSSENWTPFGIHQDFEDSIIIDVSGAGRDLYLWETQAPFQPKVANARRFTGIHLDYESLLPGARRLSLHNGAHYNIRQGVMHIFHALGPGVFIGLSCEEGEEKQIYIPPMYDPQITNHLKALGDAPLYWQPYTCLDHKLCTDFGKIPLTDEEFAILENLANAADLTARDWYPDPHKGRLLAKLIKVGALYAQ